MTHTDFRQSPEGAAGDDWVEAMGEAGMDQDLFVMDQYLDGELTPSERHALEHRVDTDPTFWAKVGPLVAITALQLPLSKREAAATRSARRVRALKSLLRRRVPLLPAGVLSWLPKWLPTAVRRGVSYGVTVAIAAVVVGAIYGISVPALRNHFIEVLAAPLLPGAHDYAAAQAEGRPRDQYPQTSRIVRTDAAKTRMIRLGEGSIVTLRPNSRFVSDTEPGWFGGLKYHQITLAGEAVLDLNHPWFVRTLAGTVVFEPGRYALRCDWFCTALYVNVGSGSAVVTPIKGTAKTATHLVPGSHLIQPLFGAPTLVTNDSGFPPLGVAADSVGHPPARGNSKRTGGI